MLLREPFGFVFRGYSVWLEVSQTDGDLEKAVSTAAIDGGLYPIAAPHVTVAYGFTHLSEEEAKHRFRNDLAATITEWPALETKGSLVGVEFAGVNGGEMDMSWMEVSLGTSPEHEKLVEKVYGIFGEDKSPEPMRSGPWQPHISIAYDNPETSVLDELFADKIFAQYPSLLGKRKRDVVAISLWKTDGQLWDWQCVDKLLLNATATA